MGTDFGKKVINTSEKIFLQSSLQVSMAKETLDGPLTRDMIEAEICRRLQDDVYDEYLVDGAVLTCSKAKWDDFELSDGDKVALDEITEEKKGEKPTRELRVLENPLSEDGLCHGTVTDAVLYQNISPFQCNCRVPATMEQEQKIKANIKTCREAGVCQQLIDLEDKWENINFNVPYATFSDAKQSVFSAGDFIATSQITSTEVAEGIMMTSVLFCKHGGFIYPLTSGQKIQLLEQEEQELTDEELAEKLKVMFEDKGVKDANIDVVIYMWHFFRANGFSEYATAGILGNVWVETGGTFNPATIRTSGGYYGLFQWGEGRREELFNRGYIRANDLGLNKEDGWKDEELQCQYALDEFYENTEENTGWVEHKLDVGKEEPLIGTKENFMNAQNAEDAALIWGLCFERCVKSKDYHNGVYSKIEGQPERKDAAGYIYTACTGVE